MAARTEVVSRATRPVYRLAKPRQLDKLRERIRECSLWHEAQLRERADQRIARIQAHLNCLLYEHLGQQGATEQESHEEVFAAREVH
jgi:hypothetical protein